MLVPSPNHDVWSGDSHADLGTSKHYIPWASTTVLLCRGPGNSMRRALLSSTAARWIQQATPPLDCVQSHEVDSRWVRQGSHAAMVVAEMQSCLAALYVDEPLRRKFYENPDSVLQDYRLTERERAALKKLDREGLDRYASWLVAKRRKRLKRAFPTLFTVDREVIEPCFRRYRSLFVRRPNEPKHQEIEDFGLFAEQYFDASTAVPDWLSELARYERMRYAMTHIPTDSCVGLVPGTGRLTRRSRPSLRPGVALGEFRYDAQAIVAAGGQAAGIKPADRQLTIVFRSVSHATPAMMFRISGPTRALLHCCDGRRIVDEVIAVAEDQLGQIGLEAKILDAIEQLRRLDILRLTTDPVRDK